VEHSVSDVEGAIMRNTEKWSFNSLAVHGRFHPKGGPVNPPVERSSTYVFKSCEDGAKRFASENKEGIYSRLFNLNCHALETKIAALEEGYGGITTSSGMAAVEAIYFTFLNPGSHIVATGSVYGPSRSILEKSAFYHKWGVRTTFLDTSDVDEVRKALQTPNSKLLFVETPANPTLSITDIAAVAEIAANAHIPLVVDNTFCSPYLQKPLALGADIVVHSMTKCIGGHSNAVGGVIITKTQGDYHLLRDNVINRGAILSPDNADLFNTGVKTLGLRMERMQENAMALARYLANNAEVNWVMYPGLEDHPRYDFVTSGRQMRGPGSMITFGVKGGYENAKRLLDGLNFITLAVSLGGVESLIQHPASMTHAGVSEDLRIAAGITNDLIRFSAGIEDIEDLEEDFDHAFRKL